MAVSSKRKRQIYLEFLIRCGQDIDALPSGSWKLFRHFRYKDFIVPMVREDKKLLSIGQLSNKFEITPAEVKYILYEKK